jgi:putative transcriptional regulator
MADLNFAATVVYLFEADADGAAGVILNRPSDIVVGDALPSFSGPVAPPDVVFVGGPVQTDHALVVAEGASGVEVTAFDEVSAATRARVFAGYAGWGAGQLAAEISEGGWFVVEAEPGDPFTDQPQSLWRRVFARQEGVLRRYRTYPDDPRFN